MDEVVIANYIVTFYSFAFSAVWIIMIFVIFLNKRFKIALKEDKLSRWAFIFLWIFVFNFTLYHLTYFVAVGNEEDENKRSLKEICDEPDLTLKSMKMEKIDISNVKVYSNLLNIFNLHFFHSSVGLYLMMLLWIMEHK